LIDIKTSTGKTWNFDFRNPFFLTFLFLLQEETTMTKYAAADTIEALTDVQQQRMKWMTSGVILPFVTAAVTIAWVYIYNRRKRSNTHNNDHHPDAASNTTSEQIPRRASFTSLGLAIGTFPIATKVPEAIINAACYFNPNDLPSMDTVITDVVLPLLTNYERMSLVLDTNSGLFQPATSPYEPKDMVRIVELNSSSELVLHQTIFAHHNDSLMGHATSRPWWEILMIQNNGPGPSALVLRVHHALADGLSLVHAFAPLLAKTKKTAINDNDTAVSSQRKPPKDEPIRSRNNSSIFKKIFSILEGITHVVTLGMTKYDHDTVFSKCNHGRMKFSGRRDVVMLPTISLPFIKQLKTAADCTVNTIVMTALSQAIHDYCVQQNDPMLSQHGSNVRCRALLPVGFPRSDVELSNPQTALSNKWCMISCDMCIGYDDILHRLQNIHTSMSQIKQSSRPILQLLLQNMIVPFLPHSVARQAVMDIFARHSVVFTNVPGPDDSCELAGKTVTGVQLFFSNLLTQVNIISYAGHVHGNVVYDPDALPNFDTFGMLYAKAYVQLAERLSVQPTDDLLLLTKK
jgi:WS/DGAT C-terminal domain/Wax ester synthase-like Acyl-CoA acyltransferase domain